MATAFRTIAVSPAESELSGVARPPGFTGTAERPGRASTFGWWVVFHDEDGAPLAGGTATLQWYGVTFDGQTITTPEIGGAVAVDGLVIKSINVGAGVWPWCRATAMTPPVGGETMRIYLVETIAGVDTDAIAEAVAVEVAAPSAAEVATAVGAQAAAAAAYAAAWGDVQLLPLTYVFEAAGAAEVLPSPGVGFRLEILAWTTYNFNSTMFVTFRSGGVDLDANPRMMLLGTPLHEAAVSPYRPLYSLAENADFGLTMDVSQEYLITVQYRIVPT